mmetsp:Transcript_2251/g.5045  ORF Transcript_2251/g.5045 Transcript_2251/m.5045 type:complete len:205 (-) Transcript_2251:347-961(-)
MHMPDMLPAPCSRVATSTSSRHVAGAVRLFACSMSSLVYSSSGTVLQGIPTTLLPNRTPYCLAGANRSAQSSCRSDDTRFVKSSTAFAITAEASVLVLVCHASGAEAFAGLANVSRRAAIHFNDGTSLNCTGCVVMLPKRVAASLMAVGMAFPVCIISSGTFFASWPNAMKQDCSRLSTSARMLIAWPATAFAWQLVKTLVSLL